MKQTLHSPLGAKKWVWAAGAAAVMVVLLRSRLSGAAGTLLTLGILILFIDLLANAVLADFEYAVMDDMFVYKRKFQKTFGCTPHFWANEQKLSKAALLLDTSNYSITDICFICGFSSLSTFHAQFRKKYGISPGIYRKNR